jgi:hypothetical protein
LALRVACGLDGTIADMEGALQREAEIFFAQRHSQHRYGAQGFDLRSRLRNVIGI